MKDKLKLATYHISIDDSYTEWIFPLVMSSDWSIDDIHEAICESLGTVKLEGKIRKDAHTITKGD